MIKQKVIFFGTGNKSEKCLKYLHKNFEGIEIIGLCQNFYKKNELNQNKTIEYAKSQNIKILKLNQAQNIKFDLGISYLYDKIFNKKLLSIPKKGIINLHLGPLPMFKGSYSVYHAINNLSKSNNHNFGVTLHYVESKVDNGPIIDLINIPILNNDTAFTLYNRSINKLYLLFTRNIRSILETKKKVSARKQSKIGKFYKRNKINHQINIKLNNKDLYNKIRALTFKGKDKPYFILKKRKIYLIMK